MKKDEKDRKCTSPVFAKWEKNMLPSDYPHFIDPINRLIAEMSGPQEIAKITLFLHYQECLDVSNDKKMTSNSNDKEDRITAKTIVESIKALKLDTNMDLINKPIPENLTVRKILEFLQDHSSHETVRKCASDTLKTSLQ